MSRHIIRSRHDGLPVLVVAGYDRPLRELFLQVIREAADTAPKNTAETFIYDSLDEPHEDWTDINTLCEKLARLDIQVPRSLIDQIYLDQVFNVGSRIVEHPAVEAGDMRTC
jgi:hypothetical protein